MNATTMVGMYDINVATSGAARNPTLASSRFTWCGSMCVEPCKPFAGLRLDGGLAPRSNSVFLLHVVSTSERGKMDTGRLCT